MYIYSVLEYMYMYMYMYVFHNLRQIISLLFLLPMCVSLWWSANLSILSIYTYELEYFQQHYSNNTTLSCQAMHFTNTYIYDIILIQHVHACLYIYINIFIDVCMYIIRPLGMSILGASIMPSMLFFFFVFLFHFICIARETSKSCA